VPNFISELERAAANLLARDHMDELAAAAAVPSFQDITIVDLNNREIPLKVSVNSFRSPAPQPLLSTYPNRILGGRECFERRIKL
jgi:hypothetical protein